MDRLIELRTLIASDDRRMQVLRIVRGLGLPDCWVAAGFVRNCVWDHAHGRAWSPLPQDVQVRLGAREEIEVAAPLGLDDLFDLIVRPTRRFLVEKHAVYLARVRSKHWEQLWPSLQIQPGSDPDFRKLPRTGV